MAKIKSKFNNKKVTIDDIRFDSILESRYYLEELKDKILDGTITVSFHPKYTLIEAFKKGNKKYSKVTYSADFLITENASNHSYLVDTKGVQTKDFKIKRKLFDALYDIELKVITWNRKERIWEED